MVDSAYALWLQSAERTTPSTDATLDARWGALARTAEVSSPLSTEAGANNEAPRVIAFLGGPLALERVIVAGVVDIPALRGRCVSIEGVVLFVLGGYRDHATGTSELVILRRL